MTEKELRQRIVAVFEGWYGLKESDGSHMRILDIYNGHRPLPRGYKVKRSEAWCAAAVSAAAIQAGLTDIIPVECGCGEQINLWQQMGRWQEKDDYVPQAGDYIYYDWKDSGDYAVTDNKGWPRHVGLVVSVSGNNIRVIEGNKSNAVEYREIPVNGRYIRGYGLPDYAGKAAESPSKSGPNKSNPYPEPGRTIRYTKPTMTGEDVKWVQWMLVEAGYNIEIDGRFGPKSNQALRAFQELYGLEVDGRCGPATRACMLALQF